VTDDLTTRLLKAINTASRDGIGAYIETLVAIHQDTDSVRGPGWYEAHCDCGWLTSGDEPVVEDAARQHVLEKHPPLISRLCQAHRDIVEAYKAATEAAVTVLDRPVATMVGKHIAATYGRVVKRIASAYGLDTPREDR
jgi:hypothetical protein